MHVRRTLFFFAALALVLPLVARGDAAAVFLPDGRTLSPTGFTIPVEGFATNAILSPDGAYFAVLSEDGGAIDVIDTNQSLLAERLSVPSATDLAWTSDGLYVSRGYTGKISRFSYEAGTATHKGPTFTKRADLDAGGPGLVNGVVEDPASHRVAVARTADREIQVLDDMSGATLSTLHASAQPYDVAFVGASVLAADYNSDRVDLWENGSDPPTSIVTGAHPTRILVDGMRAYVANADGADVALVDVATRTVVRHYNLSAVPHQPPGQTPSGMALSTDGATLFVCESGFNDVAIVDVRSGAVRTRVPTAWYPMAIGYLERATAGKKDPRKKQQLWIVSARGLGQQPDPAGEWNGRMTGLVQHLIVDRTQFPRWSSQVARNDRFSPPGVATAALPPIRHVMFIVVENKHFDEEFGDEPRANADPSLLVYGRSYTPNRNGRNGSRRSSSSRPTTRRARAITSTRSVCRSSQ